MIFKIPPLNGQATAYICDVLSLSVVTNGVVDKLLYLVYILCYGFYLFLLFVLIVNTNLAYSGM